MNYLETIKNITKDKERRTQNLILLIGLLVILLVSINLIFDEKKESSNKVNSNQNIIEEDNITSNFELESKSNLEAKLENILSQISGISEVSVVITYSQNTKQNVVYNTKEETKEGGTSTEKSVAYNEDGNTKTAIVESVELPKVEGAIVVAKGANSVEIRSKIATAISSVTNIAAYKVQVFEKQG